LKLSDIMQLDFRKEESKQVLVQALWITPFFDDGKQLAVEDLEKIVFKIRKKYPIVLAYIMSVSNGEDEYYSAMLKRSDTNEWLTTIYGKTMFEIFGKTIIFMYSFIKKNFSKKK